MTPGVSGRPPLQIRELAAMPIITGEVRAYVRHCYLPDVGEPDPLWVNASQESRWRTLGGTLYLAEDAQTAWAESCRARATQVQAADPTGGVGLGLGNFEYYADQTLNPPVDARALFEVRFHVERLVDLTRDDSIATLRAAGFEDDEMRADDYGRCPDVAQYGEANGWQAIRAPSAALDGGVCVAVMATHHPATGLWRILQPSARPTVATAYLTRYRHGERPAWLDGGVPAATAA